MTFNSIAFAFFFPAAAVCFLAAPRRAQVPVLLLAGGAVLVAYAPACLAYVLATVLSTYMAAIRIEANRKAAKRWLVWVGIAVPCGLLAMTKYAGFIWDNAQGLAGLLGWAGAPVALKLLAPLGISFYTFKSVGYVVDVYTGKGRAERDLAAYAAYVTFFPQLVAGPIDRARDLLPQFHQKHEFDYDRVTAGLRRMALGFFKKLVIADRLALYVNDVYASPRDFSGLQLTIATVFFAYQIYCDFSGYSDIAIGCAAVLGFRGMENFKRPYSARSVAEFWRRWHLSLSFWFRDYIYIPLGGSRVSAARWALNVMATFAISGLWHGANWTFVFWGALNGCYLVFGAATLPLRAWCLRRLGIGETSRLRGAIGVATTFTLMCAAWVPFRAGSLADAVYILTHFHEGWDFSSLGTPQFLLRQMPAALGAILVLEGIQFVQSRVGIGQIVGRAPTPLRWAASLAFVLLVILFGVFRETQFLYGQF
jgi:D-alanyl-lipoteichoic acid acyltransferase DltB (MBOAT superfamily)